MTSDWLNISGACVHLRIFSIASIDALRQFPVTNSDTGPEIPLRKLHSLTLGFMTHVREPENRSPRQYTRWSAAVAVVQQKLLKTLYGTVEFTNSLADFQRSFRHYPPEILNGVRPYCWHHAQR